MSEAHALVSLRGRALRLLALRGPVIVDGEPEDEIELCVGQLLRFGDVHLRVSAVMLPDVVLALRIGGGEPQELCAGVYSLIAGPEFELVPREEEGAPVRIWSTAEGWCIQFPDGNRETLEPGRRWSSPEVEVLAIPIDEGGASATIGRGSAGLVLHARYTSTHILRPGRQPVVLDGQPGRLLSELAVIGAPVEWSTLAQEFWPGLHPRHDRDQLRRNWDRVVRRLRLTLREHGIRDDLVRADGTGNVELVLHLGDRVRDGT